MRHTLYRAACMVDAARLLLRVRRQSKRTGIPFEPLLEAHLNRMRHSVLPPEIVRAIALEDYQRQAREQAVKN